MIRDLRSVIGWLPARERWRWLLLVPVAGLAALIEAAGALAVFGLLRLVVDPEQVRTAPVVSRLWAMWPTDPRSLVALLALGVGAFYVLRAVFLGWAEWTGRASFIGRPPLPRSDCSRATWPPITCSTPGADRRR